jgi:hypothetical protein
MMSRCKLINLCFTAAVLLPSLTDCFHLSAKRPRGGTTRTTNDESASKRIVARRRKNNLGIIGLATTNSDDDDDGDWKKDVVTKEMFLRDILEPRETDGVVDDHDIDDDGTDGDVSVTRKKKGKKRYGGSKEYKVLDNRDILPFRVTLDTPDPYTHPEIKKKNAARTRKHGNAVEEHLIKSTLYRDNQQPHRKKNAGSTGSTEEFSTLLGEYQLGKDTTTGDILLIGNSEYKVVRHRCQYKYAGAQRFVMVRKILEVKEVGRLLSETVLKKQWNQIDSLSTTTTTTTEHPLFSEDP